MELLSKNYPTKEKTLKGMLARGIQGMAYQEFLFVRLSKVTCI
jgi:hypothetical protein